ncbi:Glyoxalase/Bleomycin resistance protein/Dihydroxybiphenyl dioxygenase [Kockiozyma suomiensis]|uniref:Glyoxalase/Bleomycin resistance protein/Dihydroxybiphenyl dioxygenase n=1 Tax=Kockiozyma suomiensis TaxID=1337062 RepID=UPI0033435198
MLTLWSTTFRPLTKPIAAVISISSSLILKKPAPAFTSLTTCRHFARLAKMTDVTKYKFNHTMLRVKDPKASIAFYQDNFGMKLIRQLDFPEAKFSLYFLAFDEVNALNHGKEWTDREGLLELTHNYGTENDPEYKITNGNTDPHRGFGHLCMSVDNIELVCEKMEANGVKFQKRLTDGRQKDIAFALDPDGYWVELIWTRTPKTENFTDPTGYRLNHTMIRVKDPKKSLKFYQEVLGMKLLRTAEHEAAKFTLYFLGYNNDPDFVENSGVGVHNFEGVLELTWNWGTESDPEFKGYHNGNDEPQGFGHICVSVDDIDAACARFEELGVNWKKRLTDGRMKNVAFVLDDDNYWVEVIQNEAIKKNANW